MYYLSLMSNIQEWGWKTTICNFLPNRFYFKKRLIRRSLGLWHSINLKINVFDIPQGSSQRLLCIGQHPKLVTIGSVTLWTFFDWPLKPFLVPQAPLGHFKHFPAFIIKGIFTVISVPRWARQSWAGTCSLSWNCPNHVTLRHVECW